MVFLSHSAASGSIDRVTSSRPRFLTGLLLVPLLALLPAGPAGAVITSDTVGCTGQADINSADGNVYRIDAGDDEAKVPREGSAAWQGGLSTVTHDHRGEVNLELPLGDVELGSWGPSPNAEGRAAAKGVKELPAVLKELPAGRYKVRGYHEGNEGGCTGHVVVEIDDFAFSNIAGVVGIGGTVLFAVLLALAARPRTRA